MNYIEKRSINRIPAGDNIMLIYRNEIFLGTILNLSEKGMFIGTSVCFPANAVLLIENDRLKILGRVKRSTEMNGYYDGVGVELAEPTHDYLGYLNRLKAPL